MQASLKVKRMWLQKMQGSGKKTKKTAEVRKYPPAVRVGSRFFLLCGGEVWGSASLASVDAYRTFAAFAVDVAAHGITAQRQEFREVAAAFRRGRPCFAWRLRDFSWFPAPRPRSGGRYLGIEVPAFKGQRFGWVWSTPLPAALEASAVPQRDPAESSGARGERPPAAGVHGLVRHVEAEERRPLVRTGST